MASNRAFQMVDVGDVKGWLYERTMIDHNQTTVSLGEMSESVKEKGVIEPIILRRVGGELQGVAGFLRYKATLKAGLNQIPAIVYESLDDIEATDILLIENTNRQEMADVDVANVLQLYVDKGYKNKDIAERIHMSESYVSRYLGLLGVSEPIRQALSERTEGFTEKHARLVKALPEKLHKKAVEAVKGKTVKEAKEEVNKLVAENRKVILKAEVKEVENQLADIDKAEKEKLSLEEKIAQLKGKLATLKTDDKQMNQLTLEIELLRSRYFPAVEELTKARSRRTEVVKMLPKYDIEPLKKERDSAYSRIAKIQDEVKKLVEELKEKRKALKDLNDEAKRVTEKISYSTNLKKEQDQLDKTIESLETTTKDLEKKHATAIKNFDNLKESVNSFQADLIEKRKGVLTEIGELSAQVRALNGKIANRKMVLKRLEDLKADLKSS